MSFAICPTCSPAGLVDSPSCLVLPIEVLPIEPVALVAPVVAEPVEDDAVPVEVGVVGVVDVARMGGSGGIRRCCVS
jgi:hypothetical protein